MTRRVSRVLLFFRGCQLPAQVDPLWPPRNGGKFSSQDVSSGVGRSGRQSSKQRQKLVSGKTQFKAILEMFKQQHVKKTLQTTPEYNLNAVTAWLSVTHIVSRSRKQ